MLTGQVNKEIQELCIPFLQRKLIESINFERKQVNASWINFMVWDGVVVHMILVSAPVLLFWVWEAWQNETRYSIQSKNLAWLSLIQLNISINNHNQLSKLIPVCNFCFQSCLVFTMSFMFRKGSFTKEEEKRKKEVHI